MEQINKIVNLTAHTINEVSTGNSYPVSGIVARVKQQTVTAYRHAGIPVYRSKMGEVEGLPATVEGTIYIVSALALMAVPKDRTDVVSPGSLQRNERGQPIGCMGFRTR